MARRMRERVIEVLDNYPITRDVENPDTMIFCLMLMEDGIIDKYKAKEIYDKYSINNVVKSRQEIQNKSKEKREI